MRWGQAAAPGLQLRPGGSVGPDEFHRVSGCSNSKREDCRELGGWVSQREVAVLLGPDQGTEG